MLGTSLVAFFPLRMQIAGIIYLFSLFVGLRKKDFVDSG